MTDEIVHEAYKSDDSLLNSSNTFQIPPYLQTNSSSTFVSNWTDEYPEEFRYAIPTLAGYVYKSKGGINPDYTGYYKAKKTQYYDFQLPNAKNVYRGLIMGIRDPLGNDVSITYYSYDLLPIIVTDPMGLSTRIRYNYTVLQPEEITDVNGNRTLYAYTSLGRLSDICITGKVNENIGDSISVPSTKLIYDYNAFVNHKQPIYVRTIHRINHINDNDVSSTEIDKTIEKVEYSDGFGRLLQTRTQAEDTVFGNSTFGDTSLQFDSSLLSKNVKGHRITNNDCQAVIVSGWQIYDNKGRIIKKYEPFFSTGFDYACPKDFELGSKITMYYDTLGRNIRTLNPEGSENSIFYGTISDLSNPSTLLPNPWEVYTYDANDNAGNTHNNLASSYQQHWNTPSSILLDIPKPFS